jgi:ABC-type glycerol-3-phosphate transport system substrate-binding protein
MRGLTCCMFLVAGLMILTGCGQKAPESGKVEVTFWHVMGGPLGKALDAMIEDFNSVHEDVEVKSVSMGRYQALSQKLMAAVAARTPPTIAQVYESWTAQFMEAGALVPLNIFIEGDHGLSEEDLADIYPVFVESNIWEDKFVTVPFNKSVLAYFYNKDMFREAGITDFPKTWTEFRDVAIRLTRDADGDGEQDVWGTAFAPNVWMFSTILYQKGGRLLNEAETQCVFNEKEGVETLTFLHDLVRKDRCANLTTGYQGQDAFLAGQAAMVAGSVVSYAFMQQSNPTFEMGVAPVPVDKHKAMLIAGTNVGIFSKAGDEEQQAAWEFIRWFIAPEQQARWGAKTGYIPVRRSSLSLPVMQQKFKDIPGWREVVEQIEYAMTEPRHEGWFGGRNFLRDDGLEPALRGTLSPKEALDQAARKIDKELQR